VNTSQARETGKRILEHLETRHVEVAYTLLAPILAGRTPFRLLDVIGSEAGQGGLEPVNVFLEAIAARKTMGGWVVIASALGAQLSRDLPGAFERCRNYVVAAEIWYATDILGERVPGPALVTDFDRALAHLEAWRRDTNGWVRRTVGVAVHFWAKRSRGAVEFSTRAGRLLTLLEPMFEDGDMEAVKGIGWGLKTLGRHYPELLAEWLKRQLARPHRALMSRKAMTYLSPALRAQVTGKGS